ncbi:energy-coupling factor ABC transporter ATP-binding protein [bacterium]|nr:energy-coupling factor ABC transporter ATP-binding protein [bacterium]MBU1153764.1 energy-coupling factor ABC transporter ATP-binding protein [bacterium]MBU1781791.1 energy-coupling factor ABC transporter ATP-binding protein [bacterium]
MSKVIFELKEVYFSYLGKFPAVCGIDMTIEEGQKLAIIGANGSGKSTLLHLLDGLIFPDKGNIKFRGKELKEESFGKQDFSLDFRRSVGLVFQNPDVQLFCPTVQEDILFGPLQLGVEKEEIKKRFDELITILNIKDLLNRAPHQLSIGEKRKVAIASSLIINPDILILDEPTAGLDPLTTRHILDLLIQANDTGKTIITSTHDLHIVEEISDFIYVFGSNRKIIKSGKVEVILQDTKLLQENNLVHIHSHRHKDKIHIHPHTHMDHHQGS